MMLASRNCGPKWRVGLGTARAVMTAGSASRTRASAIAINYRAVVKADQRQRGETLLSWLTRRNVRTHVCVEALARFRVRQCPAIELPRELFAASNGS